MHYKHFSAILFFILLSAVSVKAAKVSSGCDSINKLVTAEQKKLTTLQTQVTIEGKIVDSLQANAGAAFTSGYRESPALAKATQYFAMLNAEVTSVQDSLNGLITAASNCKAGGVAPPPQTPIKNPGNGNGPVIKGGPGNGNKGNGPGNGGNGGNGNNNNGKGNGNGNGNGNGKGNANNGNGNKGNNKGGKGGNKGNKNDPDHVKADADPNALPAGGTLQGGSDGSSGSSNTSMDGGSGSSGSGNVSGSNSSTPPNSTSSGSSSGSNTASNYAGTNGSTSTNNMGGTPGNAVGGSAGGATYTFGPFDVYVSVQQPDFTIYKGGAGASADEGRVIDIDIANIQGPILVNPKNFHLNGPACPTYTATGRRIPATPAPNTSASFQGIIRLDGDNIPAPGTSQPAQFSAKDNGYWTVCSKGIQNGFNQIAKVLMNIKSINIKLSPRTVYVCKGTKGYAMVADIFPATGGTVTWALVGGGKAKITNSSNAKCELDYVATGDDKLVATLTVGSVKFNDTVLVKASELQFTKKEYDYLIVDNKINLKNLLTPTSTKTDLTWLASKGGDEAAELPADNPVLNIKDYAPGDEVTVTVIPKDGPGTCEATATFKFYGLGLEAANETVCDGEELPFVAVTIPDAGAASAALLGSVAGLQPKSKPSVASKGNVAGTVQLRFTPFDATFNSKVRNMIWYSNQADNCNDLGDYKLWAEGTVNGVAIKSTEIDIHANADGSCVNGSSSVTQEFTGLPGLRVGQEAVGAGTGPGGARQWFAYVSDIGTYARDPKGDTKVDCDANSQFRALVAAEETYHKGQIEGNNGVLCATLWIVANVYNPRLNVRVTRATRAAAITAASDAFWTSQDNEITRCSAMFAYPQPKRCALESEAKANVRASYILVMKCAYPRCP